MTYMETRFLLDDLKLQPKDGQSPKTTTVELGKSAPPVQKEVPEEREEELAEDLEEEPESEPESAGPTSGVSVVVDQLARPGAVVSGKVTFSDGQVADWYLDQLGRFGVSPKQQGYRPSQPDLMAFQAKLQNELAKMGF